MRYVYIAGPELYSEYEFKLSSEISAFSQARLLADECANLLKKVEYQRPDAYQIELRPVGSDKSKHSLFLRMDPVVWFQLINNTPDHITKGEEYVVRCKNSDRLKLIARRTSRISHSSVSLNPLCECTVCGYFVFESLCILRNYRNVHQAMLLDQNVIALSPSQHRSNDDHVRDPDAWMAVLEILQQLGGYSSLQRLYVNFGKWQIPPDRDERWHSHACIHIVPTYESIEQYRSNRSLHVTNATKLLNDHRQLDAARLHDEICQWRAIYDEQTPGDRDEPFFSKTKLQDELPGAKPTKAERKKQKDYERCPNKNEKKNKTHERCPDFNDNLSDGEFSH